jgi:ankyrin repeat protein
MDEEGWLLIAELDDLVNMGEIEGVRRLLDGGLDVNSRNVVLETPLYAAVWTGNYEIAEMLLNRGADPNIPDKNGFTPLQAAQKLERRELVSLLRDYGAR